MNSPFTDNFRCPDAFGSPEAAGNLSAAAGYFRFGSSICYGRLAGKKPSRDICGLLPEVSATQNGDVRLPFDFSEVITNLRQERYRRYADHYLEWLTGADAARSLYYFLRPIMAVPIRKHLQKIRLAGWDRIRFPRWPVDVTVEALMRGAMAHALKAAGRSQTPFIWFWPDGASSAAMMTHDVEGSAGGGFCGELMDLDDSFGIKSAFQLVPEPGGDASKLLADGIRSRGFEVNLHDLNHDGYLFHSRSQFLKRAERINHHAQELQCRGFRSAAMYREQGWFDALAFSYDMSVPNVAHLEAQRGGCCTVMPYFIGDILELPLTTTQDYSLFHILDDYSVTLWKEQMQLIMANHGLISFIAHPDYLIEGRARDVYRELLSHLSELRATRNVWTALPGEVDRWWRDRRSMKLVPFGGSWRVEGVGSERARVAHARLTSDGVVYEVD